MKKLLKIISVLIFIALTLFLAVYITYIAITHEARLNTDKLINYGEQITICDDDGNEISNTSLEGKRKSVLLEELPPYTVQAFIASEDANFYKHNGLNYKRMIKALYTNLKSGAFKEGASTISQQLIKNTHLSNDKTLKRKLNEIKLTRQLEKKYSKNQILEMYLNTIYFGHNCYGLQSAANFYFDTNAENLTLEQSATLVGLLSSPNNYSPFKNPVKSIARRNLVLKSMLKNGYIDQTTLAAESVKPLSAKETRKQGSYGDYITEVFAELENTDIDFYKLSDGCKIKTYLNPGLQKLIETSDYPCDNAIIVTSTKSGGVSAYKSTIGNAKRQPGSAIKPLLVYGPAIEEKLVNPFTKINDEKTAFNDYSPENYDKKYHGYVSVTECLKQSYNIPAVKILNTLTLDKAEKYASAMGISIEDEEKNLSLALGGMSHGVCLKKLCDGYSAFPNGGTMNITNFIKEICDKNGKVIYKPEQRQNRVFSAGTCSLMNEMLMETAQTGTAKKLKNFSFQTAAKTGTCGNEEGNTDAYTVCYTSEHCIGVWLGDKNNERLNVTGGKDCCEVAKNILLNLYQNHSPEDLDCTSGTETIFIDREEYQNNNKIIIADDISPILNKLQVKVLSGNIPQDKSTKFTMPKIATPGIRVENSEIKIELCQEKYYSYLIKRLENDTEYVVYDGKWQNFIVDSPQKGSYVYTVTPYYLCQEKKYTGQTIFLPMVNVGGEPSNPQIKIPEEWYNE